MRYLLTASLILSTGCATQRGNIAAGMIAGAAVGAGVGHQFIHHGQYKQYETQNTIISAVIFSLVTGGVMAWHYRAMNQQQLEISGRFARARLCDPDEAKIVNALEMSAQEPGPAHTVSPKDISKTAVYLDDSTKWLIPAFRKRFLEPERGDNQVISERYIWEIIRPGSFVTRSQNPQYFYEGDAK